MRSQHDPELPSGLKSTEHGLIPSPYKVGSGVNLVKILSNLVISPATLVSLLIPIHLSACGLFDLKSCFTGGSRAEAEVLVTSNSQNLALLQATPSPSFEAATSSPDISIVDGVYISGESYQLNALSENRTIADDQISIYVVREGDTLPTIAKMFGVTVNTIRWGNDIKGNTIKPGQTLVILPITGIQHTVKSGETLQSIAKLHKGDLDEILQYNNLTSNAKLKIGDVIIVPDGEAVTVVTRTTVKVGSSQPSYSGYYMRPILGGVKTQGVHGHNGVDLASSYGANILASADGQVIIARTGYNGGYGTYIVIKHGNGTQTLYGHLSSLSVSPGDNVVQGQVIGKMGSTGKSTGVHVHFEVRGAKNPF